MRDLNPEFIQSELSELLPMGASINDGCIDVLDPASNHHLNPQVLQRTVGPGACAATRTTILGGYVFSGASDTECFLGLN